LDLRKKVTRHTDAPATRTNIVKSAQILANHRSVGQGRGQKKKRQQIYDSARRANMQGKKKTNDGKRGAGKEMNTKNKKNLGARVHSVTSVHVHAQSGTRMHVR